MTPQPTLREGEGEPGAIFGRAATLLEQERPVDLLDVDPAVLDRLDGVGDLEDLARGLLGVGEGSISGVFHRRGSVM